MTTTSHTEAPNTRPVDTEVRPTKRPARSAQERLRIVEEYDSYPAGSPERGALLRREGVYSSALSKWRKLRHEGALQALATQQPGSKPAPHDPKDDELALLRAENARLQARLAQAELILDMQKNEPLPRAAFNQIRNAPACRLPLGAHAPTIGCGIPKTRPRNLLVSGQRTSDQNP